jgi:hypothetical protein
MVNRTGQSKTVSVGESILRFEFSCLENKGIGYGKYPYRYAAGLSP